MITLSDCRAARERIANTVHETPILTSGQLNETCGNDIFLKSEHLQKTGSFKIRGATNKITQAVQDGATHVIAASSGNHGQAVAYTAKQLGVPATIVVPEDASACKLNAVHAYTGKTEVCGTTSAERIPRAKELAEEEDGVLIPPYDDPYIMAGQGTVGLEILEQLSDVDVVVVPIGGSGLMSGVLTAIKESNPAIQVIGVEPETAQDTYLSLKNGGITAISPSATIADGLRATEPGHLTFPVLEKYLDGLVLVTDDEIRLAFTFTLERMKQLIEPSSATAVAAAMTGKLPFTGKKIVCVASGGNVDVAKIEHLLV